MALLITETIEDVRIIKEAREDGKKNVFIEGIFLMGDIKNRNGRMYRAETLDKEVRRYTENYINQKRAYGELNHPQGPTINLDRVSHMIESLTRDGSNFIGRAKITSTPMGEVVKGLIEDGANLGVSSRGMGSIKMNKDGIMEVQDDFMLATAADIVADPSAPNAFVRGILENTEWVYDVAEGSWRAAQFVETAKKQMNKMTVSAINENSIAFFEQFLNKLSRK